MNHLEWRAHLREIKQAIADGEQASLNEQDWAEIYYAIVDGDSEQDLAEKIGPDGRNMIEDTETQGGEGELWGELLIGLLLGLLLGMLSGLFGLAIGRYV